MTQGDRIAFCEALPRGIPGRWVEAEDHRIDLLIERIGDHEDVRSNLPDASSVDAIIFQLVAHCWIGINGTSNRIRSCSGSLNA